MKKAIILLLFFSLKVNGFGQKPKLFIHEDDTCFVLPDSLKMENFSYFNKPNQSFSNGIWIQIIDSSFFCKFTLKNNILHGKYTYFRPEIEAQGNYTNGTRQGPYFRYNKSGDIVYKCYFESGNQLDSYFYYNNRNLKKRFLNTSDTTSFHSYYYLNGFKKSEGTYFNKYNVKTSEFDFWKIGKWSNWFGNGVIKSSGYYNDGKKDSVWKYYNEKSEFEKCEYYKKGILIKSSFTSIINIEGKEIGTPEK